MESIQQFFVSGISDAAWPVIVALLLLLLGRKIVKILLEGMDRAAERAGMEKGIREFLRSLAKVGCYGVLAYAIADLLGIPTASFLALLGSAGLAVSLAMQGNLSNFASGVVLLAQHPFTIGERLS